jgi:hypothetical protein
LLKFSRGEKAFDPSKNPIPPLGGKNFPEKKEVPEKEDR